VTGPTEDIGKLNERLLPDRRLLNLHIAKIPNPFRFLTGKLSTPTARTTEEANRSISRRWVAQQSRVVLFEWLNAGFFPVIGLFFASASRPSTPFNVSGAFPPADGVDWSRRRRRISEAGGRMYFIIPVNSNQIQTK